MRQQRAPPARADPRHILKAGVHTGLGAQIAVMGDGKAMAFIANALDQVQGGASLVPTDRIRPLRQIDLLKPLGQSEHRHLNAGGQHRGARESQLLRSAVHQHQIRQGPALLLLFPLGTKKPAAQHLVHRGEIVGPFHRLDAEVPVFLLGRLAVNEHDHRSHRQRALGIGNIKAFNAVGHKIKLQRLSQFPDRAHRTLLFDLDIGVALEQSVFGIFLGCQYQRALIPPLGYRQRHRAFPALTQPGFQILKDPRPPPRSPRGQASGRGKTEAGRR